MSDKDKNCLNEMQEMPIPIDEYIDAYSNFNR